MNTPALHIPKRGNWRPGRTNFALFVTQVAITSSALVRGIDYFRAASEPEATIIVLVQDSPPLPTWGVAFIGGALLVIAGMVGQWARVIAVGHIVCMAAYASAGFTALRVTGFGAGLRLPYGLFTAAVIHGALAFFIFAILRQREELARRVEP